MSIIANYTSSVRRRNADNICRYVIRCRLECPTMTGSCVFGPTDDVINDPDLCHIVWFVWLSCQTPDVYRLTCRLATRAILSCNRRPWLLVKPALITRLLARGVSVTVSHIFFNFISCKPSGITHCDRRFLSIQFYSTIYTLVATVLRFSCMLIYSVITFVALTLGAFSYGLKRRHCC